MKDLIDRQDVLRVLYTMPPEELKRKLKLIEIVKLMPSAQLEEIRETGISRYGVAAWLDNMGYTKLAYAVMDKDRFPSAQPERKRGKWIPVTNGRGGHECSSCHNYAPSFQTGDEWLTDYCPNCGARMEGE